MSVRIAAQATPVVLLTGWGQRLIAEGELPSYVDCVLSKPPKLNDLRAALAKCCPPVPRATPDASHNVEGGI